MTGRALSRSVAVLLVVWCAASVADEAAVSFLQALQNAPGPARAQISKLIAEKYPELPEDITQLIARERPNFFSDIQPDLDALVAKRHPNLQQFVEGELGKSPQVQASVDKLIAEKYADLVAEIQALPPGEDRTQRASDLVRDKYPDLLRDMMVLLREEHPKLITEIQRKVQVKFPTFIADAGAIILAKYPELTGKIVMMVVTKHAELLPQIAEIIMRAEEEARAAGAAEEGAAEVVDGPLPVPEEESVPEAGE